MGRIKFALSSEAAQKNSILTYLSQIWHLMALLMLDEGAAKLQKKAVITFLTKKEASATLDQLLSNPFNWKVNQSQSTLGVKFSAAELLVFVEDLFSLRNVLSFQPIDEPFEVPCAIIGAQLTELGPEALTEAA